MKVLRELLGALSIAASFGMACAQTPAPVLGNIEAPYTPLQSSVKIAGTTWPAGVAAYGPVGTPLVLSGSNLGGNGTVQFVAYKNGTVDTSVSPVQATVTLWNQNMLILTVPSGAMSGLVTVTVEGQTSNGLPFLVTPGAYAGSCPAHPAGNQLQITTTSLHDGTVDQSYSATLNADGGSGSYTWSITSGSLPAGLSLSSSGAISGTPTAATGPSPSPITFRVSDTSSPPVDDEAEITLTIESQTTFTGVNIYSYTVGYDAASNVTQFQDATYNNGPGIMGTWSITPGSGSGYDSLNRLSAASVTWPDGHQQSLCWDYDSFGNRQHQLIASGSSGFTNAPGNACQIASGAALVSSQVAQYNSNNQISDGLHTYDAAGDVTVDATTGNQYLYDAEGRLCAVYNGSVPGMPLMTGYLYDAEGTRVAKGAITTMSCDPTTNGFQFTENYVLGPSDEELTMLDGSNNWKRTNVYVGGRLIGTYDVTSNSSGQSIPALHFHLEDALGTRRMQVSGMLATLGQPETDIQSLPFGDGLTTFPDQYAPSTADDATPLHFTGKERDSESGNDYFGARYYASTMGRFLSPDPSQLYYANPMYPQSLNLYSYVTNNPLIFTDPDGLDCVYTNNQSSSSVDVTIVRGDCINKGGKDDNGVFVDGTVDASSVHYYVDRSNGASSLGYNFTNEDDSSKAGAGVIDTGKVSPTDTDGQLAPSIQNQFIPTVATMDKAFLRSIPVPCGVGGTLGVGFGNNRAGVDLSSDKGLRAAYSRRLVNTPFVSASYSVKGSFSSGVSDGVSLSARIPEAPLYTVNASLSGGGITSLGAGENAGIFNTQLYVKTGNALTGCSAH